MTTEFIRSTFEVQGWSKTSSLFYWKLIVKGLAFWFWFVLVVRFKPIHREYIMVYNLIVYK